MAQEFVLPLALAYKHSFEGNDFTGDKTIQEWIRAGIAFAEKSAHPNGSCDDYYPFERAAGAAAFSLYAIVESIRIADLDPTPFKSFLGARATWLARHQESGRLSNHEALIANGLFRVGALYNEAKFFELGKARLDRLLTWQSDEGWFFEYQGCDPGYLTLTIANMAEAEQVVKDIDLTEPLTCAVRFLHALQPADGWLGGEWTSRNTNNFFPHGFEILGKRLPEALEINSRAIKAMAPAPEYSDDHIIGHHTWSYLKAAVEWNEHRPRMPRQQDDALDFPGAGLSTRRCGGASLLVADKKGGSFRLYQGENLICADTGVSLKVREGRRERNYVCHLWSEDNVVERSHHKITISGKMGQAKASQMTPVKNMVLRAGMLTIGRVFPDLVRQILQRILITGKADSPFRFRRELTIEDNGLLVRDVIEGGGDIVDCGIGPAQTSIYTVMSRVYHPVQRQPWLNLKDNIKPGDNLRLDHTRKIGPSS